VRKASVEERRTEILATTCRVVIERGFAATRVSDVAERLGVSSGLIHYHFESKEQLLAAAFAYAAAADLSRLDEELARPGTAVEQLDRLFHLYTSAEAEPEWLLWIDGWGEAIRDPAIQRISRELDLQWQQRLEDVIGQGVAAGELSCSDAHATAWRLAALLDGLGLQMTVHQGVISPAELLAWVRAAACLELALAADAFAKRSGRGSKPGAAVA
jgi:AcrR family transcriptional regulator